MSKGRILISGLTIQHIGRDPRLKYDHLTKMYVRALTEVGYEVEHREVTPEEDLSGFDAMMIGLGPLNGLSCRYTYGAMDAVARARRSGVALLFFNDDWQVQLVLSSAKTMMNEPTRFVKPMLAGARVHHEWAKENLDHLMTAVTAIHERPWPTTVIPQYSGGDSSKFVMRKTHRIPSANLVGVDPTSYGVDYAPIHAPDNERWGAWILGALSNQLPWLEKMNLSWKVGHYGGKASKSENGALSESDLVQTYAKAWGVLSPPYWHAGSGWWRLRHDHARQAGSILVCGPQELAFMGDVFTVSARDIEQMSIPDLRQLADAQNDVFAKQTWSKEEFETKLDETFRIEIEKMA